MIDAQLGDKAVYSHHANSAFGIPFQILGLAPNVGSKKEWIVYLIKAPLKIWRTVPKEKLYIAEADADRPKEPGVISKLLKPEATLWVSVYNTHSMNFDSLVNAKIFNTHLDAIAYEFGVFIAAAKKLVAVNGDQEAITNQLSRIKTGVEVERASEKNLEAYSVTEAETVFKIQGQTYKLPGLHPKSANIAIQLTKILLDYLHVPMRDFANLEIPPGRSNILKGKQDITIIDSTYNNGLGAVKAMLDMYQEYPSNNKWIVIADLLELGSLEKSEHEKLAELLSKQNVNQIILLGHRNKAYTYPAIKGKTNVPVEMFDNAGQVLTFINSKIKGGETILFKGAIGLEGVIEELLVDPTDSDQLVRRGPVWTKRRQGWGLPK